MCERDSGVVTRVGSPGSSVERPHRLSIVSDMFRRLPEPPKMGRWSHSRERVPCQESAHAQLRDAPTQPDHLRQARQVSPKVPHFPPVPLVDDEL